MIKKEHKERLEFLLKNFIPTFKSIKGQFVIPVLALLFLVLTIAELMSFGIEQKSNREDLKNKAASTSKLAALSAATPLWTFDNSAVEGIGKALFEDKEVWMVEITTVDGTVIYSNNKEEKGHSIIESKAEASKDGQLAGFVKLGVTDYYRALAMKRKLLHFIVELLLVCIILWLIINIIADKIVKPIKKVTDIADSMSQGDFTSTFEISSQNEVGEMATGLEQMSVKLSALISDVSNAATLVDHASREIADGNQDLSQRTQEQASTLEQVAATIEEITTSIQQTATNSEQADKISQATLAMVQEGEHVIEKTMDAMQQISASSRQIAEIIMVVNDIAFQTNLLALNAAVEAARAGEQGRGFAVVAAEVRNLAGRAAESSKEIEKLIKESVVKVENGNHLVRQSGDMLQQIVKNTKHNSDVVSEITAALREQSNATEQIKLAVNQMNLVTQQNSLLVEQVAASGVSLHSEAENLTKMVAIFKVRGQGRSVRNRLDYDPQDSSSNLQPPRFSAKKSLKPGLGFKDDDLNEF